jgi:hypothetical protein
MGSTLTVSYPMIHNCDKYAEEKLSVDTQHVYFKVMKCGGHKD